jgi:hypothetical protein
MAPPNGPHRAVTILVTGAAGQVGREVVRALRGADLPFEALGREDLDIRDRAAVHRAVQEIRPSLLVNCAAYTSVDGAESSPEAAFAVNALGARHVAEVCAGSGVPLVHFSTDYVFSGATNRPWVETDAPAPVNVYGTSKLEGEEHIRRANPRHLILRTSWVFGVHGSNFVRSILAATRRAKGARRRAGPARMPNSRRVARRHRRRSGAGGDDHDLFGLGHLPPLWHPLHHLVRVCPGDPGGASGVAGAAKGPGSPRIRRLEGRSDPPARLDARHESGPPGLRAETTPLGRGSSGRCRRDPGRGRSRCAA